VVLFVTHVDSRSFLNLGSGCGLEVSCSDSLSVFDSDDSQSVGADAPEGADFVDEVGMQVTLEEIVGLDAQVEGQSDGIHLLDIDDTRSGSGNSE